MCAAFLLRWLTVPVRRPTFSLGPARIFETSPSYGRQARAPLSSGNVYRVSIRKGRRLGMSGSRCWKTTPGAGWSPCPPSLWIRGRYNIFTDGPTRLQAVKLTCRYAGAQTEACFTAHRQALKPRKKPPRPEPERLACAICSREEPLRRYSPSISLATSSSMASAPSTERSSLPPQNFLSTQPVMIGAAMAVMMTAVAI